MASGTWLLDSTCYTMCCDPSLVLLFQVPLVYGWGAALLLVAAAYEISITALKARLEDWPLARSRWREASLVAVLAMHHPACVAMARAVACVSGDQSARLATVAHLDLDPSVLCFTAEHVAVATPLAISVLFMFVAFPVALWRHLRGVVVARPGAGAHHERWLRAREAELEHGLAASWHTQHLWMVTPFRRHAYAYVPARLAMRGLLLVLFSLRSGRVALKAAADVSFLTVLCWALWESFYPPYRCRSTNRLACLCNWVLAANWFGGALRAHRLSSPLLVDSTFSQLSLIGNAVAAVAAAAILVSAALRRWERWPSPTWQWLYSESRRLGVIGEARQRGQPVQPQVSERGASAQAAPSINTGEPNMEPPSVATGSRMYYSSRQVRSSKLQLRQRRTGAVRHVAASAEDSGGETSVGTAEINSSDDSNVADTDFIDGSDWLLHEADDTNPDRARFDGASLLHMVTPLIDDVHSSAAAARDPRLFELAVQERQWVKDIRSARQAIARSQSSPPELVWVAPLDTRAVALRDSWKAARLAKSPLAEPLREAAEDVAALADELRSVTWLPRPWLQRAVEWVVPILARRAHDLALVPPRRRRLLFKLLAVRCWIGSRSFLRLSLSDAAAAARSEEVEWARLRLRQHSDRSSSATIPSHTRSKWDTLAVARALTAEVVASMSGHELLRALPAILGGDTSSPEAMTLLLTARARWRRVLAMWEQDFALSHSGRSATSTDTREIASWWRASRAVDAAIEASTIRNTQDAQTYQSSRLKALSK